MTTLYLFPTSKEAEGLLSRRADLKSQVGFVGVGMAEAAASTARLIVEHRPRRVVLCGIAGACDECLRVGEVVEVVSDSVAELPARFALKYHSEPITRLPKVSSFTVSRTGASLPLCENYKIVKDGNGRGEILIDTGVITASQAISFISDHVDIKDISVTGETIDETVVSLYKEFAI